MVLTQVQLQAGGAIDALPGGVSSYLLIGVVLLIGIREIYRRVRRSRAESTPTADNKPEGGLETGEDDPQTENQADSGEGPDFDSNRDTLFDSSDSEEEAQNKEPTQNKETGRSVTDWLLFWRTTQNDQEEETSQDEVENDPRIEGEGLAFTAEFDDILTESTKRAITDPDRETEIDKDLPPNFDGGEPEEFFEKIERLHQRQIAPNRVKKDSTHYKVGKKYRRVLYAHKTPDMMPLAGLKEIVEDPSLHFDMTIHFHALDQQKTLKGVENLKRNLDAAVDTEISSDELAAGDKARRREKVRKVRQEMKQNNQRAFEMSFYIVVGHENEEKLLERVDEIRHQFRTTADIRLETVERKQKKALKSASPLGIDPLYEEDVDIDPSQIGLGRSFGALMASLSESSKFEPSGHEWGVHAVQGHPIVKDPFSSPRNYNMVIVGESGTGKSVNAKKMALETKATKPETLIIMLDPLQGFLGLAEALDAKKITIGGGQPINPMEIRKPPQEHIESEAFDDDKDPLSAKVDDVMNFIQNYVAQQPGLEFGNESQLLRSLILAAYQAQGITHKIETHNNESPTLQQVNRLAEHVRENPEDWATGPEDPRTIQQQASKIGTILREFREGGQYENLSKRPDEDIFAGNGVIYLDLHQQEASGGSGTGIAGQLLFSTAYELCKQHPGPALYIIDEARFLFREADTLDYLAQRVRHSRHYNTSIRFITQEMDDFFEFEQAEGIVHNSSFHVIHQSADIDDWGDKFNLKPQHKRFVKNAATGKQVDYSQALVRFPEQGQWYPLTIDIGQRMLSVVDFDEQKDRYEDLPGRGQEQRAMSPVERELVARVRNGARSHDVQLSNILADWEKPMWEMLTEDRAERCLERIASGEHPRRALYTEALDQVRWLIDTAGGEAIAPEVVDRLSETIKEHYDKTYRITNDVDMLKQQIENGNVELQPQSEPAVDQSNEQDAQLHGKTD